MREPGHTRMRRSRRQRLGSRPATALAVTLAVVAAAGGCRSGSPLAAGGPLPGGGAPAFAVSIEPTVVSPVPMGAPVGLRFASSVAGFGHLYLMNTDGSVVGLAENLALAPGVSAYFPRPGDGVELRASPPAGVERLILLVTLQRFAGPAGSAGQPLTRPVPLVGEAGEFLNGFAQAVDALPAGSWAAAETYVEVVD